MEFFNIVSYSVFREQMASHLHRLKRSNRPTLLLQNGDTAAFVLSPAQYHELTEAAEEGRWLRRLEQALHQADFGQTAPLASVARKLRARGARRKKP